MLRIGRVGILEGQGLGIGAAEGQGLVSGGYLRGRIGKKYVLQRYCLGRVDVAVGQGLRIGVTERQGLGTINWGEFGQFFRFSMKYDSDFRSTCDVKDCT